MAIAGSWRSQDCYRQYLPVIFALLAVLVAVPIGVFLIRPRLKGLFSGDFQGIKTEAILAPIITLTVFLSAFVVAQATQTYQRANQQASTEASAVGLLYENAGYLPDGTGLPLQSSAVCYSRAVVNYGWPAMQQLKPSDEVDAWVEQFSVQIPKVLNGPGSVVGQIVGLNRTVSETRSQRLYDAAPHLPLLTIILMVGAAIGVVLALSSLAVTDMRRRVVLILATSLAVLLGGTLYLVEQLEEPFTGIVRVEPKQMSNVSKAIAKNYVSQNPGETLPCDVKGKPLT